jgi:hypothetical protein
MVEWANGFGYSNNAAEASHLTTILNDMRNNYLSVYARVPFQLNGSDLNDWNPFNSS